VRHIPDLVLAIRAGQVTIMRTPKEVSCESLARTYFIRSSIASEQGGAEIASAFAMFALRCKANVGPTCNIWLFDGLPTSYAAFELQPSQEVAACFKFDGSLSPSELDS